MAPLSVEIQLSDFIQPMSYFIRVSDMSIPEYQITLLNIRSVQNAPRESSDKTLIIAHHYLDLRSIKFSVLSDFIQSMSDFIQFSEITHLKHFEPPGVL